MMLNRIIEALNGRSELAGWTVRHLVSDGTQVYAVPKQTEAQRAAGIEQYKIDVLRRTKDAEGNEAVGSGNATVLPGGNVESAIETAVLTAGLVANPVHTIPAPASLPDVALVDMDLQKDAARVTGRLMEQIQACAAQNPMVYLTAAECFGEVHRTHLVNSRGIDAEQESTEINIEVVLHSRRGDQDVETFVELSRRRVADLEIEQKIDLGIQQTLDQFEATHAPAWEGPVVLRGDVLATFMAGDSLRGGVLHTLGNAEAKYRKYSSWEIGKSVFRSEVRGDPLTVWANRQIPYGIYSNRFDDEGLPAQRVQLIRNNELVAFSASQRYADYLGLPATGAFGGVELPAGRTAAASLLEEPYVEIVQFSWFFPDPITGDFSTEIRFGYLVENGVRKPFRGGQLVGNFLEALADARWGAETGMFGNYLGPHTVRFNNLKISG
jgi:predicted Zn-dependent protease